MTHPSSYSPPQPAGPIDLDLSRNEGRPPGPELLAGLVLAPRRLARYSESAGLRARLAARAGVAAERVLVTAGADDGLLRASLATLAPGREALVATPTFEMIPRYVALAGGTLAGVPWPEGPFPVDALLARASERTALALVVSPNNPTGATATAADLERVARALPRALVVLDAAYAEFAEEDLTGAALALENVVVLRTLSKAWGLAGLRVGYMIGAPGRIATLFASGNPFPVSSASAAIAERRLDTGADEMRAYVERVRLERAELAALLRRLGARGLPSATNFVLAREVDAKRLVDVAAARGIALRRFPDQPELAGAVRITCPGDPADFARLTAAIEAALAPATPGRSA